MLRPRIIPCLLYRNKGLVKTFRFGQEEPDKYVGDPINAVRIFNEKEVDELLFIDIDATAKGVLPNFDLISKIASECRMPLCYGGGVTDVDQIGRIISMGVEKVALSSSAVKDPAILGRAAQRFGSQSIVAVIDYKAHGLRHKERVFTHNGERLCKAHPLELAQIFEQAGAGEIVLQSIDRDGMRTGYDINMARQFLQNLNVPITVLGGASDLDAIIELIRQCGTVGAAAGSLFVFKGKYRAVLINYPNREEKQAILNKAMEGS